MNSIDTPSEASFPLSGLPLLKRCSSKGLSYLEEVGEEVRWKKGQQLIHEGMPTHGIYFILQGKMKVVTCGIFGLEQVLRLGADGDILGHRGINEKGVFPVGIHALEDSLTFYVELEDFYTLLEREAKTSLDLMFFFADELRVSEQRMERLTRLQVRERVADALLYIHEKFGDAEDAFPLPLSRHEIGELAATNQDQVSRSLSEFDREGRIELQKGWIRIRDGEYLRSLSEGA
jgi:CRP-like cAMP-binding protein